jgi:hypothetical protein
MTAVYFVSAGSPMCPHSRVCAACHVLWNVVYVGAGIVQLVAGIFFLISLPIFKMGSNIWAGAWVSKWMRLSQVKGLLNMRKDVKITLKLLKVIGL